MVGIDTFKKFHDCELDYLQHCINCVVADPNASFEYLKHDTFGVSTEVRVTFSDGSETVLVRVAEGWQYLQPHYVDCATATGMYDL